MAQVNQGGAYKPVTPHPALRTAAPKSTPTQSALTNIATISGGSPPAQAGAGTTDSTQPPWQSDPILQQIQNLATANNASADAAALAARQQALINFGYSPELQPLYGDAGTAGAAKANPYSILAQLQHGHELRQTNLNESLNKANLFYSGYRGKQLGEEGRQFGAENYGAGQTLQGILTGISGTQTAAHQGNAASVVAGQQNAYSGWLNNQLQYGLGGSGTTTSTATATGGAPRSAVPIAANRSAQRRALLRRNI
jgi:hypothetical protein